MTKIEKAKQVIVESGKSKLWIRSIEWECRVAFGEWISRATIRNALIALGATPSTRLKGRNSYWIMPE